MFDLCSDITMPLNMEDAVRLQSDNLENAYGSKATSTRVSRRSTPLQSGIQTPADKLSRYQTHTYYADTFSYIDFESEMNVM